MGFEDLTPGILPCGALLTAAIHFVDSVSGSSVVNSVASTAVISANCVDTSFGVFLICIFATLLI